MPPPSHVHNGPGFHPWTLTLGGYTKPPAGKAAPNGVATAKTFAQDPTSANAEPRSQTPRHLTPSNTAVPQSHEGLIRGQRRAGCTRQPHSCVDRHPLRLDCIRGRTCLHRSHDTAARRGRGRPQPPVQTPTAVADNPDRSHGRRHTTMPPHPREGASLGRRRRRHLTDPGKIRKGSNNGPAAGHGRPEPER